MTDRDEELRELLRRLDVAGAWERPRGYRHRKARAAFEGLVERLDAGFATNCRVDQHIEDASLHGRIEIPAGELRGPVQIVVSVSNHGSMAVVAVENPGVYLDVEEALAAGTVDAADLEKVQHILTDAGYVEIPEELLTVPYDGLGGFGKLYPAERAPTWWDRYFDYL